MKETKQKVIEELREKLPLSLMESVDEVEALIKQGKNRDAYLKMYEIQKNPLWSPTSEYIHLIEMFWWNYAN